MRIEELINNVLMRCNSLSEQQQSELKSAMYIELHDVKLDKRCYEIAEVNDNESLLRKYVATMRLEGLAESTLEQYYRANENLLLELNMRICDIRKEDIMFYLAMYQQVHSVSKVTTRNMIRYISAFFNWLEDEEYIEKSPTRNIKAPKVEKRIKSAFTDEEMEKMRNNTKCIRDRALVEFMYATGSRVSEVVGTDIENIDFKLQVCKVFGKGSKERYVYLTDTAMYYLKEYNFIAQR